MRVSVVVPAFTSQQVLDRMIYMLEQQTFRTEVIVVDDGSDPPLKIQDNDWLRGVRIDREPVHRNPSFARNYGARFACGDCFLFCDVCLHIVPDAVESMILAMGTLRHAGEHNIAFTGLCKWVPEIPADAWRDLDGWIAAMRQQGVIAGEDHPSRKIMFTDHGFSMIPRALFEELGGYDEKGFPMWGHEAQDMTLRILDSGGYVYSRVRRISTGRLLMAFHEYHESSRDEERSDRQFLEKWGEPFTEQMLHRFTRKAYERRQN